MCGAITQIQTSGVQCKSYWKWQYDNATKRRSIPIVFSSEIAGFDIHLMMDSAPSTC